MKVKVTQNHISKGVPGSRCLCPIALALKDMGCNYVNVSYVTEYIKDGKFTRTFVPRLALDFMIAFDANGVVEPLEFEI